MRWSRSCLYSATSPPDRPRRPASPSRTSAPARTKPSRSGCALELFFRRRSRVECLYHQRASSTPADLAVSDRERPTRQRDNLTPTRSAIPSSTFTSALESNGGKAFLVGRGQCQHRRPPRTELDSLAVHNRGYARTPIIENFTSLQPTQILSATSKIVTVNVTNSGNDHGQKAPPA